MAACADNFEFRFTVYTPTKLIPHQRKVGRCLGGFECKNPDCSDTLGNGDNNVVAFHMSKNRNGCVDRVTCRVCRQSEFIQSYPCDVQKTIMLPAESVEAFVSVSGEHYPTCRGLRRRASAEPALERIHNLFLTGPQKVSFPFNCMHACTLACRPQLHACMQFSLHLAKSSTACMHAVYVET
jgi:hypothetical protein